MGVSVRLSRNARIYVPFWIAIPAWLLTAAVWIVIGIVYGLIWLASQSLKVASRGRVTVPVPGTRGASHAASARGDGSLPPGYR